MTQSVSAAAASVGSSVASTSAQIAMQIATQQAASAVTRLLFGPSQRTSAGRAVDEIRLLTAGEGGGIPRVYGRGRVGGQIIWASEVREETVTRSSVRGAKGYTRANETRLTEYRYSVSLAIALCEGEIAGVGRVWADGKLITLADHHHRLYRGTEDQGPDTLIEAHEGSAPTYAGVAYIVFEDLALGQFGNRVPQFNFEVERPIRRDDPGALENAVRALTIIPGSGEAVYATEPLFDVVDEGVSYALNQNNGLGQPDFVASLDRMEATLPNSEAAALVVSWFGDDLRAGQCTVRPGVERLNRVTEPGAWAVSIYDRQSARLLSETEGQPSYGGTPSDESVRQAILELKARGQFVMFHPFLLMDIPSGNGLPDPHGGVEQGAFPWRGRITVSSPAIDGTAAARMEVDHFFDQWAPMVLHYAELAASVGGVDAFLLGSELRGLTRIRDDLGGFPGVSRLVALAAAVQARLPQAEISYGADWSEYFGYQPDDGSQDVLYPLDAFWADPNVGFVGIDNYMPLADWRDSVGHLDQELASGPYADEYLQGGIASGEGFDWYYASEADRLSQTRTPITDGAYGDDWVFRFKDLWSWWSRPHTEREGGVKTEASPWVPQSKPIWFTELGCPAIDKGPNQPNVFLDPKSAESRPPYFSTGERDDLAQRAFLEAHHRFWSRPENNPISTLTAQPMVRTDRMFVYAWDARPFPDFPARTSLWADAENWVTGHWLNGRAGRVPLGGVIEAIAAEAGLASVDASACDRLITGVTLPEPGTARAALEPLFDLFQLDAVARDGLLIVRPRTGQTDMALHEADLVDDGRTRPLVIERVQDEEVPSALSITFQDELSGYEVKATEVRDESVPLGRTARIGTSVVLERGEAEARARAILAEARGMRLHARFSLPPMPDGLEVGDTVGMIVAGNPVRIRIAAMTDNMVRTVEGVETDPGLFVTRYGGLAADPDDPPPTFGSVAFAALDIPLLAGDDASAMLWLTAFAAPWPGAVAVYRGEGAARSLEATLEGQSLLGRLAAPLAAGVCGRWDEASVLAVRLPAGGLASVTRAEVLEGVNLCAVETPVGWELLQFREAALQTDGSWHLRGLLRGRRGTELAAAAGALPEGRFVLLGEGQAVPLPPGRWGLTDRFEVGPAGVSPGGFPFRSWQVALSGTGARPFAPVHLRSRAHESAQEVSWIRRTRVGGDHFGPGDVPLGEGAERYLVTVEGPDGVILQTLETSEPRAMFDQPSAVAVRVAQVSSAYGAGAEGRLVLSS